MPVETIPKTQQEASNGKAHGLARNALGWINRIINESVQEISDFSALLSAQSADQAADNRGNAAKEFSTIPETAVSPEKSTSQVEKSPIQTPARKEILLPDRAKAVGLRDFAASQNNESLSSSEVDPKVEQDSESESTPEVILESLELTETSVDCVEVTVEQIQTPNTLASELLNSQLLAPQSQVVLAQVDDVKASTSKEELDVTAESVQDALVQETVPEEMPASVEKGLQEFARKALQKPDSIAVRQSSGSEMPVAKNIEVAAQVSQDNQAKSIELDIHTQSTLEQASNLIASPKSSQPQVPSLTQAFVNTWTANLAEIGGISHEDGSRPGIEALSSSKFGSILNKSVTETGSSTILQAGKGIEIKADSFAASLNVSGSEAAANRAESSKPSKPLTRNQSLATLEKVDAALKQAAESKDGSMISLRLDPPSLGTVRVDVSFKDGFLHARISADSAQVMQLLRERAPELQVTLRKLGLDVERVSVSVNSGDSGTFQSSSEGRGEQKGQKGGNNFSEMANFAASNESLKIDHWIA